MIAIPVPLASSLLSNIGTTRWCRWATAIIYNAAARLSATLSSASPDQCNQFALVFTHRAALFGPSRNARSSTSRKLFVMEVVAYHHDFSALPIAPKSTSSYRRFVIVSLALIREQVDDAAVN